MKSSKKAVGFFILFIAGFLFLITDKGYPGEKTDQTLSPYFYVENGDISIDNFPLKGTVVQVNISGIVAEVTVKQKYTNKGTHPINGRYIFPASTRAAVHGMKMVIGEEIITAKIKERKKAQEKFEEAKKMGKTASLLKQQRPNVFSMNVANLLPGDEIDIELNYTELLVPVDKIYEFVFPTVVGPRFSEQPEVLAGEADRWIKNPYITEGEPDPTGFDIKVSISTGIPIQDIYCRSHETRVKWDGQTTAEMILNENGKNSGNRDFILNYRLAGDKVEAGLMLYEGPEENFFLLLMQPPERIKDEEIPAREYIFVVDVSGSMSGFPLNTAKKLLSDLIGNLREKDKFNVLLFAGASNVMAPSSVTATNKNITGAIRFIDREKGGGGTRLLSALKHGFSLPHDENSARTMIIITDGYIRAENDVFEFIQSNLNKMNVFPFGIGSSVNRYLIEGIARAGQGESFIVTKPQDTEYESDRFRDYIQFPLLTNVTVEYHNMDVYDIEPRVISDFFAERPLVIMGKLNKDSAGAISIRGFNGKGSYVNRIELSEIKPLPTNSALPYLWARKRISRLSDFNFGKTSDEKKMEITSLGLTYNLLTKYTSFIAIRDVIRNQKIPARNVKQPLPLPQHVSNLAVGNSLSSVPEPEIILLLMMAVIISFIMYIRNRFDKRSDLKNTW